MSSDLNFLNNDELDTNDPAKIYPRLVSLSLEEIRERLGGDLLSMVEVFIREMNGAAALDALEMSKRVAGETASKLAPNLVNTVRSYERWLPLIRKEFFMEELESELLSLAEQNQDYRNHFEAIRLVTRDLSRMSKKDLKEYFEVRKDPEREEKKVSDGLAMDEFEKAQDAHRKGDLLGSRIYYQRIVDVFARTGNEAMLAASSLELGNVLCEEGQVLEGKKLYEQSATIFERLGDAANLTVALRNLGRSMATAGDLKGGGEVAMRSLQVAKADQPKTEAKKSAHLLMQITRDLPMRDAIESYRQIILVFDQPALKEESASAHLLMGSKLVEAKRFEEGCEAAVNGLRLMAQTNASSQTMTWARGMHTLVWTAAGRTHDEILKSVNDVSDLPTEVKRLGDMCLSLTRKIHAGKLNLDAAMRSLRQEHNREPFTAAAVAVLYEDLRETVAAAGKLPAEALAMFEINHQLLILASDLCGAPELGSGLHRTLGIIHDQLGRLSEAAQTFERGAELARLAGNMEFFITMRLNSAQAWERKGDRVAAVKSLELLLKELAELDVNLRQPDDYPRVCADLAQLYYDQAQLEQAEATALDGLQSVTGLRGTAAPEFASRLQRIEAQLQNLIGVTHKATDRYVTAEQHLQQSLKLFRDSGDFIGVAIALANLAGVRFDMSDYEEALRLYNQAYHTIKNSPDQSYPFIYTERARALITAGEHAEARRMSLLALEKNPTAQQAAKCTFVLLRTATTAAERREAQSQAELILANDPTPLAEFILITELLNQANGSPAQKSEWRTRLRGLRDSFEGLQGAEINLHVADFLHGTGAESEAAIEYLERCLALVDEAATRNQDRDVQRHIFRTGNLAAQRLLQLKSADNDASLEIVLRAKARATLNEKFKIARTVAELQIQLSDQPEPVLLVEMYTLPKETLLYFITAEGLQGVEPIPITAETLATEQQTLGQLSDFRLHEAAWKSEAWRRLSEAFTSPLLRYLKREHIVCLIPAGFWHFLPLHACLRDGSPLIETNPVYYGPSSAVLSRPGDSQRRLQTCLSVGVEFEREAAWVAEWLGARGALVGPGAHPQAVLGNLQKADVVHFSCHGAYNPWRADESGVLLAYHSWLTPSLIEGGSTNADLVTLSACETAFDFVTAANDMVGLDQAFLNMGAVSVLGTLWAVDADATEIFVKAFYENLTGTRGSKVKHMSKAHALQAAIAQVRSNPDFNHPFFWAAFKLTGGWQ